MNNLDYQIDLAQKKLGISAFQAKEIISKSRRAGIIQDLIIIKRHMPDKVSLQCVLVGQKCWNFAERILGKWINEIGYYPYLKESARAYLKLIQS
jgi:hypothetical protein